MLSELGVSEPDGQNGGEQWAESTQKAGALDIGSIDEAAWISMDKPYKVSSYAGWLHAY